MTPREKVARRCTRAFWGHVFFAAVCFCWGVFGIINGSPIWLVVLEGFCSGYCMAAAWKVSRIYHDWRRRHEIVHGP